MSHHDDNILDNDLYSQDTGNNSNPHYADSASLLSSTHLNQLEMQDLDIHDIELHNHHNEFELVSPEIIVRNNGSRKYLGSGTPWFSPTMKRWSKVFLVIFTVFLIFLLIALSIKSKKSTDNNADPVLLDYTSFFQTMPSQANLEENLRIYTSQPSLAGTAQSRFAVDYTVKMFEQYGLKTYQYDYEVLEAYPISTYVAQVNETGHVIYTLSLTEGIIPGDNATSDPHSYVRPYNCYSASKDVTARLIYVNFCTIEDFELLASKKVDLSGAIAICRYGRNFRGLKSMIAEQYNMSGLLIYSDPKEDGENKGPVYPDGPYRPPSAVQRGSVAYLSQFAGDPLTPWVASIKGTAKQFTQYNSPVLPKIPIQPIGYGDARPLLFALRGKSVDQDFPSEWQGGLNFTYHIGDEYPVYVRINNLMNFTEATITNVVAKIPGPPEEESIVILGNHRDAWVVGAFDPHEGTSILVELARVFGEMIHQGWQPKRSIWLCSWDSEEQGLIGSTEFVEQFAEQLSNHTIVYLNVDVAVEGTVVDFAATPSLQTAMRTVAGLVTDTRTNSTVLANWEAQKAPSNETLSLGSGSDFTPFFQHLGIASVDMSLLSDPIIYSTYHSVMDSFDYVNKEFPGLYPGMVTMLQIWGLLAFQFSDSQVLPFDYTVYPIKLNKHLQSLEQQIAKNYPNLQNVINFTELKQSIADLAIAAEAVEKEKLAITSDSNVETVKNLNSRLMLAERDFLFPNRSFSLPGRPDSVNWYRHSIYAPGLYAGYAAEEFPGVVDAFKLYYKDNDAEQLINIQLQAIVECIQKVTKTLSGPPNKSKLN